MLLLCSSLLSRLSPLLLLSLAVNYMTAMASKNGQQGGGGQGGQVQMPSAQNQMAAALMQQQANALSAAQSAAAGGGAGGFNFDPRLRSERHTSSITQRESTRSEALCEIRPQAPLCTPGFAHTLRSARAFAFFTLLAPFAATL